MLCPAQYSAILLLVLHFLLTPGVICGESAFPPDLKSSGPAGTVIPLHHVDGSLGLRSSWGRQPKALIELLGSGDFSYYANINVGGQPFNVALDTGSSDMWIETSDCMDSDCAGVPQYSPSSTMNRTSMPFNTTYLSGSVSGYIASDIVRLGQYEIYSQVFALADHLYGLGLAQLGISGMLGLGFPSIASIPPTQGLPVLTNVLDNLIDTDRFFAFRLGRDVGNVPGMSSFTIGQHDPIVPDPAMIHYIPVYPRDTQRNLYDYWKIPLDALIVNQQFVPLSRSRVATSRTPICVFDSGTSLMVGPTSDVDALYASLTLGNPLKSLATGQWTMDCLLAIDLTIILGGRAYPIHPLDLAWDKMSDGNGRCVGGVQANDRVISGDWLFGDTVMRNIYTAHYAETPRSPPLLGLFSITTPSISLREFTLARGPRFLLEPTAIFSDVALHISYASPSSSTAHLSFHESEGETSTTGGNDINHANSTDAENINTIPLNFYDTNDTNDTLNSNRKGVTILLILATSLGFGAGVILRLVIGFFISRRRRRHGINIHVPGLVQGDDRRNQTTETWALRSRWAVNGHTGGSIGSRRSGLSLVVADVDINNGWTNGGNGRVRTEHGGARKQIEEVDR